MSKKKVKKKLKNILRPVHLGTVIFIFLYFIISNILIVRFIADERLYVSFIGPFIFSSISGVIFLYLFSHQDFFHFIKEIEKSENNKEKYYLNKFGHYGKILTSLVISMIGGPIFLALTVRFLFPKFTNRYLIIVFCTIISTLIVTSFAKGLLKFIWLW